MRNRLTSRLAKDPTDPEDADIFQCTNRSCVYKAPYKDVKNPNTGSICLCPKCKKPMFNTEPDPRDKTAFGSESYDLEWDQMSGIGIRHPANLKVGDTFYHCQHNKFPFWGMDEDGDDEGFSDFYQESESKVMFELKRLNSESGSDMHVTKAWITKLKVVKLEPDKLIVVKKVGETKVVDLQMLYPLYVLILAAY